jgi:tetratricopeptide (TPR) repeat protein
MALELRSKIARSLATALELAVFLALLIWIGKTAVADQMAHQPTLQNLRLAAQLDPSNSDYHLRLGRLFQYGLADLDADQAMEHFRKATHLSPYNPQSWLDLGAALEFQGKTVEAEACLRRADLMAPNLPAFQWAIGNFFLLHGNVDEAFRHFRIVLAGSSQYNQILFSTAWKASGDADKILTELIPRHIPTEFSYLSYLVSQQRYAEAYSVWKRIMSRAEMFPPTQAAGYIDSLIRAHRPIEAHQVWTDLLQKGILKATYANPGQNLLTNGGFEDDLLKMGFDWRITTVEGTSATLDRTTFHSPGHALLIQFSGKQNVHYRHVFQYVHVIPGRRYRLQGFMKSEGITTDSGPRLEVRDAYDPAAPPERSEDLTGSTGGWSLVALDFKTGPQTELIVVAVTRLPSRKLDNLIVGKVWVDDLSLTAVSTDTANTR